MMTRREFTGGVLAAAQAFGQSRKPNIVWIMADDLGIGDLGCYGQKHIQTPNIDRIAAEGMQFSDAYSGCTVCAPSRSVLMTGMHMGHTSIRSNPGGVPILPSDVTVAEVLKKAGYATGCYGKWGLGDVGTEGAPWKKGFDEFYGYLHQVHAHWFYPQFLFHNERKDMLPGNENGKRITYSHDVIAEKGLAFIRRNASQPFFCYMPFTIPHLELLVPEDSMKPYRSKLPEGKPYDPPRAHYAKQMEPRVAYAGMVSRLDKTVGQVMALLKELKLDENTIVFFTSDNGGATRLWGEEFFESNAKFRGHKQNLYEGGIRAPMLARWPGKIKAGSKSSHPWYFADFLATAAEIAGVPAPKTDGISVLPVLRGGKTREHEYLYWELPRHDAATGEFRREAPMQAARKGQWKGVRPQPDGPIEIYNLKDDPAETKDLAGSRADLVKEFTRIFTEAHVHPRTQKNPPQMEFPHS